MLKKDLRLSPARRLSFQAPPSRRPSLPPAADAPPRASVDLSSGGKTLASRPGLEQGSWQAKRRAGAAQGRPEPAFSTAITHTNRRDRHRRVVGQTPASSVLVHLRASCLFAPRGRETLAESSRRRGVLLRERRS